MRLAFIGRFQPFHKGHEYILEYVKNEYEFEPVIIIGSAYQSYTQRNPFTAGERYEMIYLSLNKLSFKKFHIIPVADINRYGLYPKHIEELSPSFDGIITNDSVIMEIFSKEGYKIVEAPFFERERYMGGLIREKIAKSEKWEDLVPQVVAEYIKKIDGEKRIRELFRVEDRR
ncbi:MAG: nucleotidyltransferase family protein [Thermoplasmata archaeon]|nr:nucleotidyltransferase family protein [Thermoplasmata archaeon]